MLRSVPILIVSMAIGRLAAAAEMRSFLPENGQMVKALDCPDRDQKLDCGTIGLLVELDSGKLRLSHPVAKTLNIGIYALINDNAFFVPMFGKAVSSTETDSTFNHKYADFRIRVWTVHSSAEGGTQKRGSIYLGTNGKGECLLAGRFLMQRFETLIFEDHFDLRYRCSPETEQESPIAAKRVRLEDMLPKIN